MARLDQIPAAKEVAQLGATLGRSFPYELLASVAGTPASQLDDALAALVDADLLVSRGRPPEAVYSFRHALVQDAAYESLLHSRRRRLHGRVADVLAASFPQLVETQPDVMAHHLTRAERSAEAALHWHRAGTMAAERSANKEAASHFERTLAMLGQVPPAERDRQRELDALARLAGALRATRGYAAAEIGRVCRQALELARELGSDTSQLQALNGLYSFHLVRSEYALAGEAAKNLLEVAIRAGEPTYTMIGRRAVGAVAFHLGQPRKAAESLQRALDLYDRERHAHLATLYGADHAETCACFLSLSRWVLGEREAAIALQSWAIEHARSIGHAHSLAQAYAYRAFLFCLDADLDRVQEDAQSALEVSAEHGLRLMEVFGHCTLAVAKALAAPTVKKAAAMTRAIDQLHKIAPHALRPFLLCLAAEVQGRLGKTRLGLELVDEADRVMMRTGERWAEAEIGRRRAALLAAEGLVAEACLALKKAAAIAKAQEAAGWGWRIAEDLTALRLAAADESTSQSGA